jgi:hypothetical protein
MFTDRVVAKTKITARTRIDTSWADIRTSSTEPPLAQWFSHFASPQVAVSRGGAEMAQPLGRRR